MTSQLSAVMTAMGASKPMDALAITCAIDVLRNGKGDRITFVSDDELGCGVVLCTGAWTGWEQRAFTGATAFEALLNALADHNRLPHGLIDLQGPSLDPQVDVLKSALQWLLDDMHDAGETHDKGRTLYDSVEHAAAALVEAGGTLNWYTAEDARNYRVRCEAEDELPPVVKLVPDSTPDPAHRATVDAIAEALETAEFGYSLQLTRLVDGESTYTLKYDDGSEPIEFDDIDAGYAHIAEKKRLTQALTVLTTMVRLGWQVVEPAPADTPLLFIIQDDGVPLTSEGVVAQLRQRIERLINPDHRVRAAEERAIATEKKAAGRDFQP